MAIINFGSLNLDHVYTMPHFVQPGETLSAADYQIYCGGKGLNQSVAASMAGGTVLHAGMLGNGGEMLLEMLKSRGVNTDLMGRTDTPQGHAIIQVSRTGENCIILYHGSNFEMTEEYIDQVLSTAEPGSYVILQNEISNLPYIVEQAFRTGCHIVLNPSPFEESLRELDLRKISWLILNEIEAEAMTGELQPEAVFAVLKEKAPNLSVVLTLGSRGSVCCSGEERIRQEIFPVRAVDTTGAGDTFTGYFVAALDEGRSLSEAMRLAAAGSAIAVSRSGAAPSIPWREETEAFLAER